ncbi:hypothetical protein FIBSPDRAFT_176968 [Athelia psychrophila]|uniref:Uncharacterized protein n=1 Tax=Athelia psychrophila TaxID=1759441 RepID=A0A166SN76_9AGAM|nr:hypothetical protein FIBSPDRAFT_176968 [Fibularhizoctonia sp. CBS 109695]
MLLNLERGRYTVTSSEIFEESEGRLEERARPAATLSDSKAPLTAAQMHGGRLITSLSHIARLLKAGDILINPLAHLRDLHGRLLPCNFEQLHAGLAGR